MKNGRNCKGRPYKMEPRICELFVFEFNDKCKSIKKKTLVIKEMCY